MPRTVITGSASGIGAATKALLESQGHQVIGLDLRNADVNGDLSTAAGRQAVIDEVLQRCEGSLDHLVLCAGLGPTAPPAVTAAVNYYGAVDLLDAWLPALQKGHNPSVVVVSSVASTQLPWASNPLGAPLKARDEATVAAILQGAGPDKAGHLAYAGSKNAVTVAVRERVSVWGAAGVRLNTIAPGAVQTPLLQAGLDDPRYGEAIRQFVGPIPRRATPEEIAQSIAFLLSSAAAYVHGAQLVVDGGIDALSRPTVF